MFLLIGKVYRIYTSGKNMESSLLFLLLVCYRLFWYNLDDSNISVPGIVLITFDSSLAKWEKECL